MVTWGDFTAAEPTLANWGIKRFNRTLVAYLATIAEDGMPNVHPVTPVICQGHLVVFVDPSSPKCDNLRRDGRFALHSTVSDPSSTGGEFVITGKATLIEDSDMRRQAIESSCFTPPAHTTMFELSVASATATEYEDGRPIRKSWQATAPVS
jgi:hypothetical protein